MMGKILKKKYYRICFSIVSPLNIGYGEGDKTDRDILRNSIGVPYIPASSIAGVFRDRMPDDADRKKYFGKNIMPTTESRILFYDANIKKGENGTAEKYHTSIRDSVALDAYKTAKKKNGAKFDMEVLEAGTRFVTYLEQNLLDEDDRDYAGTVVEKIMSADVSLGGKVTRGYGNIKVESVGWREFDFSKSSDVDAWLGFDLDSSEEWNDFTPANKECEAKTLVIKLRQNGGLSIRKYTTMIIESENGDAVPDMEQLTSHMDGGDVKVPVIPGTTWAGAIRHRMKSFGADVDSGNLIFGGTGEKKKRSDIAFGESYIKDSKDMTVSRNAIDRFTGGTSSTALFTEKICVGGGTELKISWLGRTPMQEKDARALAAALADLHFGLLAIGGATSVGRGIFAMESVGGEAIAENADGAAVYGLILNKIKGVFTWKA